MAKTIERTVKQQLHQEGLSPEQWSNGPWATYAVHEHPYAKVLYVIAGSIEFQLPRDGRTVPMKPGDRLDLPPHSPHAALVGPRGVVCLEAHR